MKKPVTVYADEFDEIHPDSIITKAVDQAIVQHNKGLLIAVFSHVDDVTVDTDTLAKVLQDTFKDSSMFLSLSSKEVIEDTCTALHVDGLVDYSEKPTLYFLNANYEYYPDHLNEEGAALIREVGSKLIQCYEDVYGPRDAYKDPLRPLDGFI